jgi:alkylated DNA repair dioxygenase AlkB
MHRSQPLLGVELIDDFLPDPARLLTYCLDSIAWDERLFARKTASFGVPYEYSGMTYEARPFPPELAEIGARVADACGFTPNNCLLNRYDDGDKTMGLHSDSTTDLAPGSAIAIVSVGDVRMLRFRGIGADTDAAAIALKSGSLVIMSAALQRTHRHGISREPSRGPRVSLTFRNLLSR